MNSSDLEYKFNRFMFRSGAASRRSLWTKLSKLISNGVPIIDAIKSIHARKVVSSGSKHPTSCALGEWMDKMKNGRRFSQAIDGWAGADEQMLISAGEQSGNLDKALVSASELMVSKKRIKGALISGLSYPIVMGIVATSVLVVFSYKIIPTFEKIIAYEKWHGIAKLMIDFANFSRNWMPVFAVIVIVSLVAFWTSLPRWSDGFRIKLDKYPPYSIYRMVQGSSWMLSFAALVGAGVRVEVALEQLKVGASPWLTERIQACLRGMRSGLHTGDALAKSGYGFPDVEIIDDLGVYSQLSGFDQALSIIGKEWINGSVEAIEAMMKVVFGISLLLVGAFIAFMVAGLMGMELQMADIMKGGYH